jgi:hypothetical protein
MSLAVRWCNHPGKSADAAYKPAQLAAFRDCGLKVPRMLITNRAGDVLSFVERIGQVVCKSIVSEVIHTTDGSQVVYTHLLTEFFAAKIDTNSATSTQVDWRRDYESHAYEVIDTPAEIRSAVTAYLMSTGLAFGAFDFAVTPDREWFALECNPEGQWGWIEENTGLPIADAIARHLLRRTE